jgi:hypothetical protein
VSDICPAPDAAVKLAGAARPTRSVVAAVCVVAPEVPAIVSDRAYGVALVVVFIRKTDVPPEPLIDDGLKPPLVTPVGKPDSLLTLKLTVPLKPLRGDTVTLKVADWPGRTYCDDGLTSISKSGPPRTVIIRVGGLGSELPAPSIRVSDAIYSPGVLKVMLPGFCPLELDGDPPGNTHEYLAAVEAVLNATELPAVMVISEAGVAIVPRGGGVANDES